MSGSTVNGNNPIKVLELVGEGVDIKGRFGVVHSTAPRHYQSTCGVSYIVKGPEPSMVVAECLGYGLAALVDLPTPNFALAGCGEMRFASEVMTEVFRDAEPYLKGSRALWEQLGGVFAFDVWIGNEDRNPDNLLIGFDGACEQLILIDFEKSYILRRPSFTKVVQPVDLLPRWIKRGTRVEDLDPRFKLGIKKGISSIGGVAKEQITELVGQASKLLPQFDWGARLVDTLMRRSASLRALCGEVLTS